MQTAMATAIQPRRFLTLEFAIWRLVLSTVLIMGVAAAQISCSATPAGPDRTRTTVRSLFDPVPNPELAPTDPLGMNTNGARFGCSRNNGTTWHGGTDLKADISTDCVALFDGKIIDIRDTVPNDRPTPGLGNWVWLKCSNPNISFMYCHLSKVSVAKGMTVKAGQGLGKTGRSGNAFDVPFKHLHLQASPTHFPGLDRKNYVDPEPYLKTDLGSNPNPIDCPGSGPAEGHTGR